MLKNVKRASQRKRLRGSALGCEIDRAVQWDRAPQYRRSVRVGMDLEKAKCQDFYPFLCLASFLYLIKNSEQGKDDSIWRIPRDASLTTVFFFFFPFWLVAPHFSFSTILSGLPSAQLLDLI